MNRRSRRSGRLYPDVSIRWKAEGVRTAISSFANKIGIYFLGISGGNYIGCSIYLASAIEAVIRPCLFAISGEGFRGGEIVGDTPFERK